MRSRAKPPLRDTSGASAVVRWALPIVRRRLIFTARRQGDFLAFNGISILWKLFRYLTYFTQLSHEKKEKSFNIYLVLSGNELSRVTRAPQAHQPNALALRIECVRAAKVQFSALARTTHLGGRARTSRRQHQMAQRVPKESPESSRTAVHTSYIRRVSAVAIYSVVSLHWFRGIHLEMGCAEILLFLFLTQRAHRQP